LLSPILVRPVREQLEHDRLIRLLHAKFRRKYDAAMNPGNEQNAPVGAGASALFPDLVLTAADRGHRLQTVVEVETGESVNHLEALSQWAHFGRLRAAFHLYVPANMVDVARRLCEDNHIQVAEICSYHLVGDEPRFTVVQRNRDAQPVPRAKPVSRPPVATAPAGKKPAPRQVKPAKPARTTKAATSPKSAKAAKPKKVVKGKKSR
jgi:hypothetical protein